MIGLHVSLRCRDLQVILGINFWSIKLAVANDEKENRCICYFIKQILFLFVFYITSGYNRRNSKRRKYYIVALC